MMLKRTLATGIVSCLCTGNALAAAGKVDLNISAKTDEIEGGYSAMYYGTDGRDAKLVGIDGSAATGGFRTWEFEDDGETLIELTSSTPGRTKVVDVLYGVAGKDLLVSITATESILRLYDAKDPGAEALASKDALGDWSSLCSWRSSESGWQYFYLFGKKEAVQFVVRDRDGELDILEVQTFDIPVEPTACAVSPANGTVYFATEEKTIYTFQAEESTEAPVITILGEAGDDVTGLAVYVGSETNYLLVAQEGVIDVHTLDLELEGSITLTGAQDIEIEGLSVYQSESDDYPAGFIAYAVESDDGASYGVSSLEDAFDELKLDINPDYSPRPDDTDEVGPQENGFPSGTGTLSCFAGFTGPKCEEFTCRSDCSGHGDCVGPNECTCTGSWAGPECAFIQVQATYETDGNGGDGDDPAIWISPVSPDQSRIITTTKSEDGAGLAVFDLKGKQLQHMAAGEPNNVDVIYGFEAGNRTIDLAYTACRDDNTLCFFEITPEGLLAPIDGGVHPTPTDYEVYGSCVYRSPSSGKQYIFVNSKTAEYLQYELTASANGTLSTTLVRSFTGGSGGQVEGCVTDEENELLILGEEPSALWKHDAEPSGSTKGTMIAKAGDGTLFADVEGVTLVPGKTAEEGYIIVSGQGVSVYSVFRRAAPHEHVAIFTIGESEDGSIDAVTNTDGVTAVGNKLNDDFPQGLMVVHDDANQLPDGSTSEKASFKLVSLADILGNEEVAGLGLLEEVDQSWDPRA
ncbi:hypothetical protein FQN54_009949 [Arachnomyces sp. PD_36]|nr:hypothetical protein FQN54_009949 [Arachnomyces sp. PD_36]